MQVQRFMAHWPVLFCPSGAQLPTQALRDFIDLHRDTFWGPAVQSGFVLCASQTSIHLKPEIQRVWQANMRVYGANKVYKQMKRERITVARCTVERLMKCLSLQGVRRGKVVRTTVGDMTAARPLVRVNRQFKADRPNQLWVSDFTYVSTWHGCQYVAFVIDVYARRIVGWRQSSSMRTDFVLDALEQALYVRQPKRTDALIHHSDRGSQYVSIRYSERLAEAGIEPSVGSKCDSYDNRIGRDD